MADKTLLQLRTAARQRADMEHSNFVSDPELNDYINASAAELRDLLIGKFEDYFTIPETFTISTGNTWVLPSNFYKLRGLDRDNGGGQWTKVNPFNFSERTNLNQRRYRLVGENLIILPESLAPGRYQAWIIETMTPLSSDTDKLRGVMDYDEYVIIDAAIKCRLKEESDVTALNYAKEQIKNRINAMAASRDASGEANAIADVQGGAWSDDEYRWWGDI